MCKQLRETRLNEARERIRRSGLSRIDKGRVVARSKNLHTIEGVRFDNDVSVALEDGPDIVVAKVQQYDNNMQSALLAIIHRIVMTFLLT